MLKKQLRFGRGFRVIPGNRASLLLIERKERHEFRNTGNPLPRGKK